MLIAGFLQINFQILSAAPDDELCTEFSAVVSAVVFAVVSAVVFVVMTEASPYAPASFPCRQNTTLKKAAPFSSPCMTAYSRDAPQKLRFGGEIRQRRTRRYLPRRSRACIAGRWSSVRKHPQASSRLIASIVSSLCGIAIVSTPSFLLHQWTDPFKISTLYHTIPYAA